MSWPRRLIFTLISLAALAAALHFSFRLSEPNSTQTGIWLAFALIACVLGWPEIAKSISFMGNSIELPDIKSAINELKLLAGVFSKATLEIMQAGNRWAGVSEAEKERTYQDINKMLRSFGFTEAEIQEIQSGWHRWVRMDYVHVIVSPHSQITHPEVPSEKQEAWSKLRQVIVADTRNITASKLKQYFESIGCCTENVEAAVADFEYYEKHNEHKDPLRWRKRHEWFGKR